jgi:PAS domain S-box-containing protein
MMSMKSPELRRFAIPTLAVVIATVARYASNPLLGFRSPLLFHILAVAVVAQISGTASGLIATGLSVLAIDYYFVPPLNSFGPPANSADHLALLLFVFVGVVLSIFGGRQKRSKDELLETRHVLETAQHIANFGSWDSNLVTNALRWSPMTYSIFGLPVGKTLGSGDFYECVHPDDRERVREAVAKAIEANSDYDIEHRIVRRSDREVRLVHQQAKIVKSGKSAHLVGSIKDITEKRRGEMAQQILGGLLYVCSACRRIREGRGSSETDEWYSMEGYLRNHTTAKFSHGMCPDCSKQWLTDRTGG